MKKALIHLSLKMAEKYMMKMFKEKKYKRAIK